MGHCEEAFQPPPLGLGPGCSSIIQAQAAVTGGHGCEYDLSSTNPINHFAVEKPCTAFCARLNQCDTSKFNGCMLFNPLNAALAPGTKVKDFCPASCGNCPQGSQPLCTSFDEFQTILAPVNEECCDEDSEDCSSGYPATCNEGCAAQLLPLVDACAGFLADNAMAPIKDALDGVAAKCGQKVQPCTNYEEYNIWFAQVSTTCCNDPGDACRQGYPTTCHPDCAKILRPLSTACANFLASPGMAAALAAVEGAAAACNGH